MLIFFVCFNLFQEDLQDQIFVLQILQYILTYKNFKRNSMKKFEFQDI